VFGIAFTGTAMTILEYSANPEEAFLPTGRVRWDGKIIDGVSLLECLQALHSVSLEIQK